MEDLLRTNARLVAENAELHKTNQQLMQRVIDLVTDSAAKAGKTSPNALPHTCSVGVQQANQPPHQPARGEQYQVNPTERRPPVCRLCYVSRDRCDSKRRCQQCERKEAQCNYETCTSGESCIDRECVRLHPSQVRMLG